jgi:hypothetical protein
MTGRTAQSIKNGILAIGVCASLTLAGLSAGSAEARVPRETPGDFAGHCRTVQDAYDHHLKELRNATTPAQVAAAQNGLAAAVQAWGDDGCAASYGDIAALVVGPGRLNADLTNATVLDATQGSTPSPGTKLPAVGGSLTRAR